MRRTLSGLILGLALVAGTSSLVGAGAPSDSRYFERGSRADVFTGTCTETEKDDLVRCWSVGVEVFSGRIGGTDPSVRFQGDRVVVFVGSEVFRRDTFTTIRSRSEQGVALNSGDLSVTFDALRGATVQGSIDVSGIRCRRQECVEVTRTIALDVDWEARARPAADVFVYQRVTQGDCERVFTETGKERRQNVDGTVASRVLDSRGLLRRYELEETRVCT